jgi:uncharacterized membrane protein
MEKRGMGVKSFGILLAISIATSLIAPLTLVAAKPVGVHTDFPSPAVGLIWGTNLTLENTIYVARSWFGEGAADSSPQAPAPPDGYLVDIMVGGTAYSKYTIASLGQTAPGGGKEDNWYLRFRLFGDSASSTATISSVIENVDNLFVPQDYSVVLDNSAQGIFANLRKENGYITGLDLGSKYATLYVDNAVNITSVTTGDPTTGNAGDPLTLSVTVKNTGRYTDTYSVSANAGSVSTGALAAGSSATKSVPATYPAGTQGILVTAAGSYAKDEDNSLVLAPVVRGVLVVITPLAQENENGGTLTYTVTVTNTGNVTDNFDLTYNDNAGWNPSVSPTVLTGIAPGGFGTATLSVTIPKDAIGCTWDNIWVQATSKANENIWDNKSCLAHVGVVRGANVSISPGYKSGPNGATLTYTATVNNTGTVPDNYSLTVTDNAGWSPSVLPTTLNLSAGSSGDATLSVTVPDNEANFAKDNITVTATSQVNAAVNNSSSCTAQVTIIRGVSVSISPTSQSGENGAPLTYTVTVTNTGNVSDNYTLENTDTLGWVKSLSTTSVGPISPSAFDSTTTLSVTIPENAIGGATDTITVKATGTGVSGSGSCTAQVTILEPTLRLVAGWNLIGFPLENENATPNNIFSGLNYTMYIWQGPYGPYNEPNNNQPVNDNIGYWIKLDVDDNVTVHGIRPDNRMIYLVAGWNLVHFPLTNENTTPNKLFAGTTFTMYYWDAPLGPYIEPNKDQSVKLGVGYWVYVDRDYITAIGNVVLPIRGVSVSISPSYENGPNGTTLNYTVTVVNTGRVSDNYSLVVSDNASPSWGPTVFPTSLNVSAGSNGTATLRVTVPSNAIVGKSDTVTVKATSKTNHTVNASDSCTAQVIVIRGVSVSISPGSQSGPNGTTLNYTVTVNNTSTVLDNYSLTVADNAGWSPSVLPATLNLSAGSSGNATLSVTVPDNAINFSEDNITVTATSQTDNTVTAENSCIAQVTTFRDVSVSISPTPQSGLNGTTLTYTVTVTNTGNITDNYSLTVTDTAGWSPSVLPITLNLSAGDSGDATLSVTVPSNAIVDTSDTITVEATSNTDNTVSGSDSCTAQATAPALPPAAGVTISISPSSQRGTPGATLTYTATVNNTGTVPDNYSLTVTDNAGWSPSISPTSLSVSPSSSKNATLSVTIPDNAFVSSEDNITVTAVSQGNGTIKDNDSCVVLATSSKVRVSILPAENSAILGGTMTFTVTVTNTGDNADNYVLHASDNLGWDLSLAENSLENVAPGRTRTTALTVAIPENAAPDTRDKITITATSRENENVTDNATCIARSIAITRGVSVSISPAEVDGMPGDRLSFTIKVTNTGNIIYNYDLTVSDNAGWNPSISENTIEISARENRSVTLGVAIPENAMPETMDKITVTVTSRENAAVSNSATCLARALILRRVEVTISPGYRNGPPGAMLNHTVRVTNTGRAADNYMLVVSGTTGWRTSIVPDSLALEPGESGEATLTITVPSGSNGSSMIFYVWAISSVDRAVRANATCRALALVIGEGVELSMPWSWIQIIIIAAMIVVVVSTVGYLTRRRGRGRRRSILRKVSAGL